MIEGTEGDKEKKQGDKCIKTRVINQIIRYWLG